MRTVWSHIRAASRSSCVMHLNHSNINSLASLSPEQRGKFLDGLTTAERALLAYAWPAWARPSQLPPVGNWRIWLFLAGRGAGKTRAGAEWGRWNGETNA